MSQLATLGIAASGGGAAPAGAIIQAIAHKVISSQVNVTSLTWGSVTLPAGDYILAVYIDGSDLDFPTGMTVDGNACGEGRAGASGNLLISTWDISLGGAISAADVIATGLSGTNDMTTCVVDIYEVVGGVTTWGDDNVNSANFTTTVATTVDFTAGQTGVVFGLRGGSGGFTFTGLDDEKVTDDSEGGLYFGFSYKEGLATETARAIDWTCGTSETRNLIVSLAFTP